MLVEIIAFLATLSVVAYWWISQRKKYFERLGIENDNNAWLGSFQNVIFNRENFFDAAETLYNKFNSGIVGIFDMLDPVFLIRSPEVIRQITIKEFDHFTNRKRFFVDENSLLGNSILQLEDQKWKDMRSSLSPAFTGSKMRAMFELIRDVGEETVEYLKLTKPSELNLKDFLSRYANDVIATTAFGFQINSNKDKNNEFFKMGESVTEISVLKFFIISNFPKIAKILNLDLTTKKDKNYFIKQVLGSIQYRKDHDVFRPDVINMLMEIQSQTDKKPEMHWNDLEIVAQSFVFFLAGFDTVSTTLSFLIQELLENQDCQNRLREEVMETAQSLDEQPLSYEILSTMKYMDAVILETMRKWPAIHVIDRICTKPILLHDPETEKDIAIKKGDLVQIFSIGLQRDPKYFPNPMKFDPERFSDDNKKDIDSATFFPFGIGPRMCIGNRFAILEMKSLIFHLLKNFKFEKHAKSIIPLLKLNPATSKLEPKGGFWVKLIEV